MSKCKHLKTVEHTDKDTEAHVVICKKCLKVTHVCFTPLYDDIEKGLEEMRKWGVFYSKEGVQLLAQGAAVQENMEETLKKMRQAMLMARINKNQMLEGVAQFLEENDQPVAAKVVRSLKLEVAVEPKS
jgi:hypothetical protein